MRKSKISEVNVSSKPSKCVNCGGRVVPILYGEPSQEGGALIDAGEMIMGGCCISDHDPEWGCVHCDTMYYKIDKDEEK